MSDLDRHWPSRLAEHGGVRERLERAYDEPHRAYHDRRHLVEVLDRAAAIAEEAPGADLERVLLAAWFHDAVYDPAAADNEECSAHLAEQELTGLLPAAEVAAVAGLVRMTAHHRPDEDDVSAAVLSDADLGILAAEPGRYEEYTRAVRAEYAHVPDADFRRGRAQVLRSLLDGPSLFRTAYARSRWETTARANVERELRALELG